MTKFVQRRPATEAEEYDGSRESADRVMAAFPGPPAHHLQEFRDAKWPESRIVEATQYKWYWFSTGTELDRPAYLAGEATPVNSGYKVQADGLWFGYEENGAGTGVTQYHQIPVGYVYTGWALKPSWADRKTFLADWEPQEASDT